MALSFKVIALPVDPWAIVRELQRLVAVLGQQAQTQDNLLLAVQLQRDYQAGIQGSLQRLSDLSARLLANDDVQKNAIAAEAAAAQQERGSRLDAAAQKNNPRGAILAALQGALRDCVKHTPQEKATQLGAVITQIKGLSSLDHQKLWHHLVYKNNQILTNIFRDYIAYLRVGTPGLGGWEDQVRTNFRELLTLFTSIPVFFVEYVRRPSGLSGAGKTWQRSFTHSTVNAIELNPKKEILQQCLRHLRALQSSDDAVRLRIVAAMERIDPYFFEGGLDRVFHDEARVSDPQSSVRRAFAWILFFENTFSHNVYLPHNIIRRLEALVMHINRDTLANAVFRDAAMLSQSNDFRVDFTTKYGQAIVPMYTSSLHPSDLANLYVLDHARFDSFVVNMAEQLFAAYRARVPYVSALETVVIEFGRKLKPTLPTQSGRLYTLLLDSLLEKLEVCDARSREASSIKNVLIRIDAQRFRKEFKDEIWTDKLFASKKIAVLLFLLVAIVSSAISMLWDTVGEYIAEHHIRFPGA